MNSFRCSECRRAFDVVAVERAAPERLAEHGRVEQQLLLLRRERVEPRGDDPLHRLGQVAAGVAALGEHARELLGVERVAAGAREQLLLLVSAGSSCRSSSAASSRAVSSSASGASETRQRVSLASAPARPALEQLGPRGRDDEQRHVLDPVDELVDEVEQLVVGPVQVLEDEHGRPLLGERLDEAAPRGEALVARARSALEPDERAQPRLDPRRRPRRERARDALVQLALGVGRSGRSRGCRPAP